MPPPSNGRIAKPTTKSRQEPAQNQAHKRFPQHIKLEFAFPTTQSTSNKCIPQNGTCSNRGAAVSRRMAYSIRSGPESARGVFKSKVTSPIFYFSINDFFHLVDYLRRIFEIEVFLEGCGVTPSPLRCFFGSPF